METLENKQDTITDTELPRSTEVRSWEEQMALDEAEMDAKNSLTPLGTDEDKYESQLEGFTVVDNTLNDVDELPDELPDELKDELGAPDNQNNL